MKRLLLIIVLMCLPLGAGGCQGWDVGAHWLGDGNSDPDAQAAASDSSIGRDVSRSVISGTK